jgi:hypothetical protein
MNIADQVPFVDAKCCIRDLKRDHEPVALCQHLALVEATAVFSDDGPAPSRKFPEILAPEVLDNGAIAMADIA